VGVAEARREDVGGSALAAALAEPELGHVAADRGLGRAKAAVTERRGELLLGPDRAPLHEVTDRALAELLHHLHGIALTPSTIDQAEPGHEHDRCQREPVD